MMLTNHTPEPWGVEYDGLGRAMIYGAGAPDPVTEARYLWLATVTHHLPAQVWLNGEVRVTGGKAEGYANAHVMAAGALMLALLEAMLPTLDMVQFAGMIDAREGRIASIDQEEIAKLRGFYVMAKAVVAKARGFDDYEAFMDTFRTRGGFHVPKG